MPDNPEDLIRNFANKCKEKIKDFEEAKVKCGIIGPSGSGKSSLINAIAGEKISKTGVVETTNEPKPYTHEGLILVDLPGCGTQKWPRDSYIEKLGLLEYDFFILVTAERFTENDIFLYCELSKHGKSCFVVRNKFDISIRAGWRDDGHTEEQVREIIEQNIRENLAPSRPDVVYLTSAWHPTKYDLEKLLDDISKALHGIKKVRFIADMAAYSETALKKKREVAMGMLPYYAGLSAANAFNPVPGFDIAVDISLLIKFGQEVAHIYGLTAQQVEYIKRILGPDCIPGLLTKIAQFAAKYLAKEGIILVLRKIATTVATKEATKWIPIVGPIIAAGIGYKATSMLGEDMINEAEGLAREILKKIIENSEVEEPPGD